MSFWVKMNMFFRSFFLQAGWNYVKYQNLGFAFVMVPFLRKLYQYDPEMLPSVMVRYLETFNTHPVMASFCYGAMAKQEESVAKANSVTDYKEQVAEWNGTRRGLSITAASIGDRLFWGTLKPLTLLLAAFIWMSQGINFLDIDQLKKITICQAFSAGLIAFIFYNTVALIVRWKGIGIAYQSDDSSCFGLTRFDWNRSIYNAKKTGIILSIGLILFGIYRFFSGITVDINFVARAILVVFFIILSFVTRRLRIPNIYLYLMAVVIFTLVCLF